jgi:hypothetical protein
VKPVETKTLEEITSVLEIYGAAFSRTYPELSTILVEELAEEETQALIAELKTALTEAQTLIAELKATRATPAPTAAPTLSMEVVRKMVEGPIPLSYEETLAKTAAAISVKETMSWVGAIKKHLPYSQTAPDYPSPTPQAPCPLLKAARGPQRRLELGTSSLQTAPHSSPPFLAPPRRVVFSRTAPTCR